MFSTDSQTLDDLNIFGRHGGNSVYAIYNRCVTRGGAAVLEEMFRYPLSDEQRINKRSDSIRHMAASGTVFPFQSAHFDAASPYLDNTDERTRLSGVDHSIGKKIGSLMGVDAEKELIRKGVQAVADIFREARQFLASIDDSQAVAFGDEKELMAAILSHPDFAAAGRHQAKAKLTQQEMAALDAVFRFRQRDQVQKLLRTIYYLDVYIAVAQVAKEMDFHFPRALPRNRHELILEGVYHPQVRSAVPNNIHITQGSNIVFLTGANMAGKSTFMKSLSIALFLAHMGFPVAASRMEFSVLDGMFTTINLPDNLGMGASHFYAEVLRVKKIANELSLSKNLFILFDEMFRGTNVKDAYEATIAITEAFAERKNCIFVVSTHIIEAGDVLKEKCDNVNFVYLPTRMNGRTPVYTYTLEAGITADRHGMVIINNEGILEILEQGLHNTSNQ